MVYLGEGLMPFPRRMVDRIQAGEFIEFADSTVMSGCWISQNRTWGTVSW